MALQPPFYDPPIVDDATGQQHSQAWTEYHQSVADLLADLQAKMQAAKTGIVDGSEATAGQVGEFKSVAVPLGSAIALGNFVVVDVCHLDLTPGDWDVWGIAAFQPAGTTTINTIAAWISPVSATTPAGKTDSLVVLRATFQTGQSLGLAPGHVRLLNTATQPMYLSVIASFGVSTMVAFGTLNARRVR